MRIGSMELFSKNVKRDSQKAMESNKLIITGVRGKTSDKRVWENRTRKDAELLNVTSVNRGKLPKSVIRKVIEFLQ